MRRVLIASDLTEGCNAALGRASRLAAHSGSALRIVCALPADRHDSEGDAIHNRLYREAWERADALNHVEVDLSVRISDHKPAEAITEEADRFDADLILLGAQGEPRMRDAILGTTATHLVRSSNRPVLVAQNDDSKPYGRVLVAIEDEGSGEAILRLAAEIAPNAALFAVHAFEPRLGDIIEDEGVSKGALLDEQKRLDALIEKAVSEAGWRRVPGERHSIVERGDVMTVLTNAIETIHPDLVVMGTHGRSGLAWAVGGSLADDMLLWSKSDILVVRTAQGKPGA